MSNTPDRLVPTRTVCARYDIVDRTVDRWVEAGELPPPIYIRGRRYWLERELERRERERMASREGAA